MGSPIKCTDNALIVLAAGAVTQDFVSVLDTSTPALLPYMGRPLIYQVIVNHIKKHGRNVVVVIPDGEPRLEDFLRASFGNRVHLSIVRRPIANVGAPAQSLMAALEHLAASDARDTPAFVVYGDIYFEAPSLPSTSQPIAFVQDYVESDKYSYFQAVAGQRYQHVGRNQPAPDSDAPRLTDIGAYWLPSIRDLHQAMEAKGTELSPTVGGIVAQCYGASLICLPVEVWSDLGHLDTATQIRTRLIGAREFNALTIDGHRGLITKKSRHVIKILQEINYYHKLPRPLSIYFPRLHDFSVGEETSYTMEFYSYRTLSEYFVFFNFPLSVWKKILGRLLAVHTEFSSYTSAPVAPQAVYDFYVGKLLMRMEKIQKGSPIYALVEADGIMVNGIYCHGWKHYLPQIQAAVTKLSEHCVPSVVHGDMCFSNILYDPQTSLVKLIDPRGDFFAEGCYGDPRYDLAKLLHSFHGGYDYILQEMYELTSHSDGSHEFRLFQSPEAAMLGSRLIEWMGGKLNYDMRNLLLLEALLFLSMLPLHKDDSVRQKALYIRGIQILHEVFA